MTAAELFQRCFVELERRDIPYVILHSYDRFPEEVTTDVDCCVANNRLEDALACIRETAEQGGWMVTGLIHYALRSGAITLADPAYPEHWLKLDFCEDFITKRCRLLPNVELLHSRRCWHGFYIPSPATECVYTIAKVLSKGKDPSPYFTRLAELCRQEPVRTQDLFARVFGREAGRLTDWLARPGADWRCLWSMARRRNRFGLGLLARETFRLLGRLRRPTGLNLAFLGPDGVGKSTTVARVGALLRPHFGGELQEHFIRRPGVRAAHAPVVGPHGQPPRSTLASWAKILFYFACAWWDWLVRQYPARVRTTCILSDRTFDDLLVDPRRYRVQDSASLVSVLRRLLPQPDLTFVLDASTQVIQQRKAEVDPAETERQRAVLRELAGLDSRWRVVSTEAPPEVVARTIAKQVIEYLAARQAARWPHLRF